MSNTAPYRRNHKRISTQRRAGVSRACAIPFSRARLSDNVISGGIWGRDLVETSLSSWANSGPQLLTAPVMAIDADIDELVLCLPPQLRDEMERDIPRRIRAALQMRAARLKAGALRAAQAAKDPDRNCFWADYQHAAANLCLQYSVLPLLQPHIAGALIAAHAMAINPANLDSHWCASHEALSAAAWLGIVQWGRPAMLPPSVAHVLLDYHMPGAPPPSWHDWSSSHVLTALTSLVATKTPLLQTARAVAADGVARPVFPIDVIRLPAPEVIVCMIGLSRI